ncbi:hypothetical protein KIPB_007531, partial [Kipferlia bialata]|eukprot:g7531.t1
MSDLNPKPVITLDADKCIGCKKCIRVCPAMVFKFKWGEGVRVNNADACIGCGRCIRSEYICFPPEQPGLDMDYVGLSFSDKDDAHTVMQQVLQVTPRYDPILPIQLTAETLPIAARHLRILADTSPDGMIVQSDTRILKKDLERFNYPKQAAVLSIDPNVLEGGLLCIVIRACFHTLPVPQLLLPLITPHALPRVVALFSHERDGSPLAPPPLYLVPDSASGVLDTMDSVFRDPTHRLGREREGVEGVKGAEGESVVVMEGDAPQSLTLSPAGVRPPSPLASAIHQLQLFKVLNDTYLQGASVNEGFRLNVLGLERMLGDRVLTLIAQSEEQAEGEAEGVRQKGCLSIAIDALRASVEGVRPQDDRERERESAGGRQERTSVLGVLKFCVALCRLLRQGSMDNPGAMCVVHALRGTGPFATNTQTASNDKREGEGEGEREMLAGEASKADGEGEGETEGESMVTDERLVEGEGEKESEGEGEIQTIAEMSAGSVGEAEREGEGETVEQEEERSNSGILHLISELVRHHSPLPDAALEACLDAMQAGCLCLTPSDPILVDMGTACIDSLQHALLGSLAAEVIYLCCRQ